MSLSSKKIIFLLLLIFPILFSQFDSPPHSQVLEQNQNLIQNSYFSESSSFADSASPTSQNPISSAFFTIGSISPSVDNRFSTNTNSKIFWAWGANAPKTLEISESTGACAQDKFVFTRKSEPYISGSLAYSTNDFSNSFQISNSAQNPHILPVSQIPISSLYTKNISPFLPELIFSFEGSALADYDVIRYYHKILLIGKSTICKQYAQYYSKTYEFPISYSKTYLLEYPPPLQILTQPADNEQLTISPQLKIFTLSNLAAQKIILKVDNGSLASSQFAQYKIIEDELGFQNIQRINISLGTIPISENFTQSTNSPQPENSPQPQIPTLPPTPNSSPTLISNSTHNFLEAKEFSKNNFTYQYFSHFSGILPPGYSNLSIILLDDFNQTHEKTIQIQNRKLSAITLNKTGLILDKTLQLTKTDSKNNSVQINSDEQIRSSKSLLQNFSKIQNIAALLGVAILALLGAKLFLQK